jgi:hypothetical protein
VLDRQEMKVVATWPVTDAAANYPMALDEDGHRLFVGCRRPAKVLIYDTSSGKVIGSMNIVGDTDDLLYDAPQTAVRERRRGLRRCVPAAGRDALQSHRPCADSRGRTHVTVRAGAESPLSRRAASRHATDRNPGVRDQGRIGCSPAAASGWAHDALGTFMADNTTVVRGLAPAQIEQFITDGFVRIDQAFPRELADAARAILWKATGCSPDDPATWTQPVIRLGMFTEPAFIEAANTPLLHAAFDQLVGQGRWRRPAGIGTFPVRFPSILDPGDTGWHIDVSFDTDTPDFMSWRANIHSRGRALLMLFLFSDVGEDDAPTRIRVGSQADVARQLAPAGEQGLTLRQLASDGFATSADRPVVTATGNAGTVYLCHPFLVHAAQPHRGTRPRFLAQPPLLPTDPDNPPCGVFNPVEEATARALRGVL